MELCNSFSIANFIVGYMVVCVDNNNVTSLAAWKNLQPMVHNITELIITLHRHPYELHK
jgi:hypothetical protein